jgi:hypothetical protein
MKEKLWLFIVKFILVSAPLFLLWRWKGEGWYLVLVNHLYSYIFARILGLDIQFFAPPVAVFLSLLAYVSLMIIATGMSLRTRVLRLLMGLLIMVFWHVILVEAVYLLHEGPGVPSPAFEKLSGPLYIFTGTLPFVLWILLAHEQVTGLFQRRKEKA